MPPLPFTFNRRPRRATEVRAAETEGLSDEYYNSALAGEKSEDFGVSGFGDTPRSRGLAANDGAKRMSRLDVPEAGPADAPPPVLPTGPAAGLAAGPVISGREGGRAPWYKNIRPPKPSRTGTAEDRLESAEEYRGQVEGYEPQEQEWKSRLGYGAASGYQTGARRGDPLAGVGGALAGLLINYFDKKGVDRAWKQSELAQADAGIAREEGRVEGELKRRKVDSEIKENISQAQAATMKAGDQERRTGILEGRLDEMSRSNRAREEDRDRDREFKGSEGDKNRETRKEIATASVEQRREASSNNLKFRTKKQAEDRADRKAMHADRMSVARGNLAERVASRLSQEASRKLAIGQRATAIRISAAKARAWAEKEGADFDDFIDALDENGVIITDK
jgi:hypothetical protein